MEMKAALQTFLRSANDVARIIGFPYPRIVRVLVVEDDTDDYEQIRSSLEGVRSAVRYEVEWCSGDCLGRILAREHDIYLLDALLPGGLDGFQLMEAARAAGVPGPFILMSGMRPPGAMARALKLGAMGYFDKSILKSATGLDAALRVAIRDFRLLRKTSAPKGDAGFWPANAELKVQN